MRYPYSAGADGRNVKPDDEEKKMNLMMPRIDAHPVPGEEEVAMDEADVNVGCMPINNTSNLKERMSEND
jgi:hypothetical protein